MIVINLENTLLNDVLANVEGARARFTALYLPPMLKIWEQRRPKSCDSQLDSDFVHWFLIEWIVRPNDSWGNLKKFVDRKTSSSSQFLAWWSATARHRYSDFYREKIRTRYEQKTLANNVGELEDMYETEHNDPERSMILGDALVALGECFDDFLCRSDVRIEGRLFTNLRAARPEASTEELLETLRKLGFEVKEGELTARRGRVAAQVRGAATLIGRCLSSRGFTTDEVRSALPEFVENIRGS